MSRFVATPSADALVEKTVTTETFAPATGRPSDKSTRPRIVRRSPCSSLDGKRAFFAGGNVAVS